MDTTTKERTMHVRIASAIATRIRNAEDDYTIETEWNGDLPPLTLNNIFRVFNRVTDADCENLNKIGYRLPSMSVGDLVTLDAETFQVTSTGFEKVDPPAPCGYCRRCAIHDDPGGCLEVERWERETLDTYR